MWEEEEEENRDSQGCCLESGGVFHVIMCHGSEPTLNLLVRPRSRSLELPGRAAKPRGAHPALHLPSSPCPGWSLQ